MKKSKKKDSRKALIVGGVLAGVVAGAGALLLFARRASASSPSGAVRTSTLPESGAAADPGEVEALARVITSELGEGQRGSTPTVRAAMAYTVINRARAAHRSIAALVEPGGKPGAQGIKRPFSTAQIATARSTELATWVLNHPRGLDPTGKDADAIAAEVARADSGASDTERADLALWLFARPGEEPTGGAWDFWEPGAMDGYTAAGALYRSSGGSARDAAATGTHPKLWRFRHYKQSAAEVRARWTANGERVLFTLGPMEFLSAPGKRP